MFSPAAREGAHRDQRPARGVGVEGAYARKASIEGGGHGNDSEEPAARGHGTSATAPGWIGTEPWHADPPRSLTDHRVNSRRAGVAPAHRWHRLNVTMQQTGSSPLTVDTSLASLVIRSRSPGSWRSPLMCAGPWATSNIGMR